MKARHFSFVFSKGNIVLAMLLIAGIINSCKRDSKGSSPLPNDVIQAKAWYETSYPLGPTGGALVTQSINGHVDLSKLIKPDWQHAVSYLSNNKNVIEIPVDPTAKFISTVKIGNKALNKAYSRSSYLLIGDGKNYEAYILTIIADSAYLNNDLSKLSHNTFRKQDADFSGLALYYTPKGIYLGGYAYKNGQVVPPTTTTQQTGGQKVQSVGSGNLKPNNMVIQCTDWYAQGVIWNADGSVYEVTTPWEYIGTSCTSYDDGSGGTGSSGGSSGGSGGLPSPPPPCPPGSTSGVPTTSPCTPPPVALDGVGTNKLKVDYMPLPGSSPCSVSTPPKPCATLTIKTDSLAKYFPCAVTLIVNKLGQLKGYGQFIEPFVGSRRPDLSWANANLVWNPNGGQTMLASTSSPTLSSTITLNTKMLQNSSQLLIAAAAIHETMHAYINFDVTQNAANQQPNFKINGNWLYGLDIFFNQNALPPNYRDHYEMLSDYFAQAVNTLAQWDNNAHTQQQYAMAMLYGMDTAFLDASNPANAAEIGRLNAEYQKIKTAYLITDDTALNNYWKSLLNGTSAPKLPGNCN